MLNEYEDEDYNLHLVIDDDVVTLDSEPYIEEITKDDILELYRHVLKSKPKQFPVGTFRNVTCYTCDLNLVLHKKQVFCPRCFTLDLTEDDIDPNFDYSRLIEEWIQRKNCIERIINGNVIQFVKDFNVKICEKSKDEGDECMGEEVTVED